MQNHEILIWGYWTQHTYIQSNIIVRLRKKYNWNSVKSPFQRFTFLWVQLFLRNQFQLFTIRKSAQKFLQIISWNFFPILSEVFKIPWFESHWGYTIMDAKSDFLFYLFSIHFLSFWPPSQYTSMDFKTKNGYQCITNFISFFYLFKVAQAYGIFIVLDHL